MLHYRDIDVNFTSHLEKSIQKDLFIYWNSKRSGLTLPGRKDIHPEEIVSLLPHIGLIDVLEDGQFRYRLIGTEMVKLFRKDFTGMAVEEGKTGEYGRILQSLYSDAVTSKTAVYSRSRFILRNDLGIDVSRLILPLSEDKEKVNMLLFSTMPIWTDRPKQDVGLILEQDTRFYETSRVLEEC